MDVGLLNELKAQGIAAGIHTQTAGDEGDINGLAVYDRRIAKTPAPRQRNSTSAWEPKSSVETLSLKTRR